MSKGERQLTGYTTSEVLGDQTMLDPRSVTTMVAVYRRVETPAPAICHRAVCGGIFGL